MKDAGVPRHRVRKMFARNQLRKKRAAHRAIEGAHHADHYNHGVNQMNRMAGPPGIVHSRAELNGESAVAERDQFAPVEAVGHVARDQKQQTPGRNWARPIKPEIERPPRDFVNLPSHRDRLHFQGGDDKKSRCLIQGEIGIGECECGRRAWVRRNLPSSTTVP